MRAKEFISSLEAHSERDLQSDGETDFYDRPRLTLRALNKLRKIRELRRLEVAQKRAEVSNMYGNKPEDLEDSKPPMIPRKTH